MSSIKLRHLCNTTLESVLPADAIVANGAQLRDLGASLSSLSGFRTQFAPTSGAMGYGVPAAIAAKAMHPHRIVVAFAGDGCFLMTGQELATAVQYRLNVIFIVVKNNMCGTIRMHQEREFPGHVYGTALSNPDFGGYARAFWASGEVVEATTEFAPAFARAMKAGKPALIEIRIDPEAISPNTALRAIRAAALKWSHAETRDKKHSLVAKQPGVSRPAAVRAALIPA